MKFNKIVSLTEKLKLCKDARLNHEGGLAFQPSSKLELYLKACTCLIEDRFYSKADQELELLRQVIARCDRNYVLKLAHFARTQMHLRSLPILLLAEASVMHSGNSQESKSDVRAYVPKVIRRADEPGELLAYWMRTLGSGNKTKLPNALKKGLSDAMNRFDEYQLAKYHRKGEVKLRDVLNLVHARPENEARAALYKRLLEDRF